ncbi:MAG: sugar transferase, partial [Chloroflexi bacterium]|nr:sugar transferase [Chloroflexota bacterium]
YDTVRSILSVTAAVAMSIGVYTFIPYLSPPIPGSRFDLLALFIICTCFVAAWRVAYVRGLAGHLFGRRILIIGAGYAGRTLAAAMKEVDQRNYSAIGFIDDDVTMLGKNVEGLTVLGTSSDMATVVEEYSVDEVILAISNGLGSEVLKAIVQCHYHGVPVTPMPSFFETIRGMVPVQHMGQNWIVSLQTQNRSHIFPMVKRGVDIVVSLIGLPFLILVFPFAAVAIKLTSPGPVFYKQSRLGRRARPFEIIKFRTMYDNAEAEGKPIWAAQNDVRVTPVGRFLRRTHLDELPQVINVLRGEMSLIGPRPERPELADSLESEIPFYRNRLLVRPGLTGWAQVKYGYGSTLEDALIKLQYDLYYIKYGSLYLDSVIAYKTLATILRLSGR